MAKNTWASNFGNSVKYGAVQAATNLTPGLKSIYETNESYFTDIITTLKELRRGQVKFGAAVDRLSPEMSKTIQDIMDAGSIGKASFKKFIETGDAGIPRENATGSQVEGAIGDFKGVQLDETATDMDKEFAELMDFSDLPSVEEAMGQGKNSTDEAVVAGAKAQVGAAKAMTEASVAGNKVVAANVARLNNNVTAQTALMAKGFEMDAKATRQGTMEIVATYGKVAEQQQNTLKMINDNLVNLINFNNDTHLKQAMAAMKYYDDSLKELRSIKESLLRAYPEKKSDRGKLSQSERAFAGGIFDLKEYMGVVKENLMNTEYGGSITQLLDRDFLMGLMQNAPMQIISTIIGKAIPVMLQKATAEFDKVVTNFIPAMLMKLGSYAFDYTAHPALQTIGEIFGIKPTYAGISLGTKKEPVPFDSITHRTINQVIPTYLSKILVALTGGEEMHFDHERGQFKSMSEIRRENKYHEDTARDSAFGELGRHLRRTKSDLDLNFKNKEQEGLFDEFIESFMDSVVTRGQFANWNNAEQMREVFETAYKINPRLEAFGEMKEQLQELLLERIRQAPYSAQMKASRAADEFAKSRKKRMNYAAEGGSLIPFLTLSGFTDEDSFYQALRANKAFAREYGGLPVGSGSSTSSGEGAPRFATGHIADRRYKDAIEEEMELRAKMNDSDNVSEDYRKGQDEGKSELMDMSGFLNMQEFIQHAMETKAQRQKEAKQYADSFGKGDQSVEDMLNGPQRKLDEDEFLTDEERRNAEYDRLSFGKKLKRSLVERPSEIIASSMDTLNEILYRAVFGHPDGTPGALQSIVENVSTVFTGFKTWLVQDIFRPLKQYFVGDDFRESKFYKSVSGFFNNIADAFKGKKDENGNYVGGIGSEFANEMSDMGKSFRSAFTGEAYTDSHGQKHDVNKDSVFGAAKDLGGIVGNNLSEYLGLSEEKRKEKQKAAEANESFQAKLSLAGEKKKEGGSGPALIPYEFGGGVGAAAPTSFVIMMREHTDRVVNAIKELTGTVKGDVVDSIKETGGKSTESEAPKEKKKELTEEEKAKIEKDQELKAGIVKIDDLIKKIASEDGQTFEKRKPLVDTIFDSVMNGIARFTGALGGSKNFDNKFIQKNYAEAIRKAAPKTLARGLVGGAAFGTIASMGGFGVLGSAMLGVMNPIVLGLGVSALHQNDAFLNMMYGKVDEKTGERGGGIIPKGVQDFVKKNKVGIIGGASFGLLKSAILGGTIIPGMGLAGTILGPAILGAGIGVVAHSERFRRLMFGTGNEADGERATGLLNGEAAKKVKQYMPNALVGAGLGAAGTAALGIFSPYVGAAAGGLLGIGLASNKFKETLFGKQDEEGNFLKGGLVDQIKNFMKLEFLEPASLFAQEMGSKLHKWVQKDLMIPLSKTWNYFSETVKYAVDNFKTLGGKAFKTAWKYTFGIIFDPIARLVGGLAKDAFVAIKNLVGTGTRLVFNVVKGIASAPFKLVAGLAQGTAKLVMSDEAYSALKERINTQTEAEAKDIDKEYDERIDKIRDDRKDLGKRQKDARKRNWNADEAQLAAKTAEFKAELEEIRKLEEQEKENQEALRKEAEEHTAQLKDVLDKLGLIVQEINQFGQYRLANKETGEIVANTLNPVEQPVGSKPDGKAKPKASDSSKNKKKDSELKEKPKEKKTKEATTATPIQDLFTNAYKKAHGGDGAALIPYMFGGTAGTLVNGSNETLSGFGKRDYAYIQEQGKIKKEESWKDSILKLLEAINGNLEEDNNRGKSFFDWIKGGLGKFLLLAGGLLYALKSWWDNGGFNAFTGQIFSDISKHIARGVAEGVDKVVRALDERTSSMVKAIEDIIRKFFPKEAEKGGEDAARNAAREGVEEGTEKGARREGVARRGASFLAKQADNFAHGFKIGSGEYKYHATELVQGDKQFKFNHMMQDNYQYYDPEYAQEFADNNKKLVAKSAEHAEGVSRLVEQGDEVAKIAAGDTETKGIVQWFGKTMGEFLDALASKSGLLDKLGGNSLGEVVAKMKSQLAKMTPEIIARYAPKIAEKLARVAANIPVIAGIFAIYDVYRGVNEAAAMFQIRPDQVTWKHKTTASIYNVIMGLLASKSGWVIAFDVFINIVQDMTGGAVAPVTFLVSMIYDCTFGLVDAGIDNILGNSHESLSDKQKAFEKELEGVNAWREAHGKEKMTINEYVDYLDKGGDSETNPNYGKDTGVWGTITNALGISSNSNKPSTGEAPAGENSAGEASSEGDSAKEPSAEGNSAENKKPTFWDSFNNNLAYLLGTSKEDMDMLGKAKSMLIDNEIEYVKNGIDNNLAWLFGQNDSEGHYQNGAFADIWEKIKTNISDGWNILSEKIANIPKRLGAALDEKFGIGGVLAAIFGESDYWTTEVSEDGQEVQVLAKGKQSLFGDFLDMLKHDVLGKRDDESIGEYLRRAATDKIDSLLVGIFGTPEKLTTFGRFTTWVGESLTSVWNNLVNTFQYNFAEMMDNVLTGAYNFLAKFGLEGNFNYKPGQYVQRHLDNGGTKGWSATEESNAKMMNSFAGMGDYSQKDARWANSIYGGSRFDLGGCGPTVMASVLSRMGKNVNPKELGTAALAGGYKNFGGGTREAFLPDIAKTFGIESQKLGSMNDIVNSIKSGKEVVVGGMSGSGAGPFTKAGHYSRISGINGNMVTLSDPRGFSSRVGLNALAKDARTAYSFEGSGIGDSMFPDFSKLQSGSGNIFDRASDIALEWLLNGGPLSPVFYVMKQSYKWIKSTYDESIAEPIGDFANRIKDSVMTVANPMIEFAKRSVNTIKEKGILKGSFSILKDMIGGFFGIDLDNSPITQGIETMIDKIGWGVDKIRDTFQIIGDKFNKVEAKIRGWVMDSFIGTALKTVIDWVKDKAPGPIKFVVEKIQDWWTSFGAKSFGLPGGKGESLIPYIFGGGIGDWKQNLGDLANKDVVKGHPEAGKMKDAGCAPTVAANAGLGMNKALSAVKASHLAKDGSGLTGNYFKDAAKSAGGKFNQVDTSQKSLEGALKTGKSMVAGVQTGHGGHYLNIGGLTKTSDGVTRTLVKDPAGGSGLMSTKVLSKMLNAPRSPRVLGYMSKSGGRGYAMIPYRYGGNGEMYINNQSGKECTLEASKAMYRAYLDTEPALSFGDWYSSLTSDFGIGYDQENHHSSSDRAGFESDIVKWFKEHPDWPVMLYQAGAPANHDHPINSFSGTHATVIGRKLADGKYEVYNSAGGTVKAFELSEIFDPEANGGDSLSGYPLGQGNNLFFPKIAPTTPITFRGAGSTAPVNSPAGTTVSSGGIANAVASTMGNTTGFSGKLTGIINNYVKELFGDVFGLSTTGAKSTGSGNIVSVEGNTNAEQIWSGLKAGGLSNSAIAGIMGNIKQESSYNPASTNSDGYHGLVQWDPNGRWPAAKSWIQAKGLDPDSVQGQVSYILDEAPRRYSMMGADYNAFAKSSDIDDATYNWAKWFEGYTGEMSNRKKYAHEAFNAFGAKGSALIPASYGGGAIPLIGAVGFVGRQLVQFVFKKAIRKLFGEAAAAKAETYFYTTIIPAIPGAIEVCDTVDDAMQILQPYIDDFAAKFKAGIFGGNGSALIKSYGGKGFGGLVSMMSNGGMSGESLFDGNVEDALSGFTHRSQIHNIATFSKGINIGALVNAIRSIDITSEAKQMLMYLKQIAENSNKTSSTEIIYPNGGSGGSMIPNNSSAGMSSMGSRSGGAKASSPQQIAAMQRKTNPGGTTSLSSMHSKAIELAKGAGFKNS